MAGHSKWANIKHRKERQDAKRGKLYTKLIRELTVAARGGAEPADNPRLRTALDKALEANMSRDVIDRAIKRGAGGQEGADMEDVRYEGYGPGGTALIIDCMTNNRNRTVGEVRHILSKHGGNLGTDGSVAYLFKKRGQLTFKPGTSEDQVLEIGLEAGADDVLTNEDGSIDVLTSPEAFLAVKKELLAKGLQPEQAEVSMVPSVLVEIKDKEVAEQVVTLCDMLEELDDVQQVYSNADIIEEVHSE